MSKKRVARITEVKRIALVEDPATTGSLMEAESAEAEEEEGTMDLKELKAKHADLVEAIRKEAREEDKASGERKKLDEELKDLRKKYAELEVKEKAREGKARAAELLEKADIPKAAKTDEVRKYLEESCKDEAEQKAFVESLVKVAKAVTGKPLSEERKSDGDGPAQEEFAEKVGGRK